MRYKNIMFFALGCTIVGYGLMNVKRAYAEGYGYIDSNAGSGKVEWTNTDDPADGPKVNTITVDAANLFPQYIKEKNLPAVKSFFVKSFSTRRVHAEEWQPIDHIEAMLIAVTGPVNAENDYYLYNCEVHYDRPIGANVWTPRKDESLIYLGDGTPKRNGVHLIASDGTDKTQAEIDQQTKREQEEYDRLHANDGAEKKKSVATSEEGKEEQQAESSESDEDKPVKKESKLKKLKSMIKY